MLGVTTMTYGYGSKVRKISNVDVEDCDICRRNRWVWNEMERLLGKKLEGVKSETGPLILKNVCWLHCDDALNDD